VDARGLYGLEYLPSIGRHGESITVLKRNLDLAPLSLGANWSLGAAYFRARRYDEATTQLGRTAELDARLWVAHLFLGFAHAAKGRYGEALDELKKTGDATTECVGAVGYVQALAGNAVEAQKVLDGMMALSQTSYVPAVFFARIQAGLGKRDEAFAWLEKAYDERSFWLIFLRIEQTWDSLRDDPRFSDLVHRVGIPELSQPPH
jgi:tetratricopeptide (TPR) repeat protein